MEKRLKQLKKLLRRLRKRRKQKDKEEETLKLLEIKYNRKGNSALKAYADDLNSVHIKKPEYTKERAVFLGQTYSEGMNDTFFDFIRELIDVYDDISEQTKIRAKSLGVEVELMERYLRKDDE